MTERLECGSSGAMTMSACMQGNMSVSVCACNFNPVYTLRFATTHRRVGLVKTVMGNSKKIGGERERPLMGLGWLFHHWMRFGKPNQTTLLPCCHTTWECLYIFLLVSRSITLLLWALESKRKYRPMSSKRRVMRWYPYTDGATSAHYNLVFRVNRKFIYTHLFLV